MKKFLSVHDVANIDELLSDAMAYQSNPHKDHHIGRHKRLGLLFFNPSLRTRISTQVAASNLGMECIVFNVDKEGWKLEFDDDVVMNGTSVEHIKDAAPVLGAYFDVLAVRTFPGLIAKEDDYSEKIIQQFVLHCGIPVISLESATLHPLQSLADTLTIKEEALATKANANPKVVLSWAPHVKPLPQCVANSFAEWMIAWGKVNFVITHPPGLELDGRFIGNAKVEYNQDAALSNADFIYIKNWSSVDPYGQLKKGYENWMLTPERLDSLHAGKIMHCLPVRRNVEVSAALLDSPRSLVTKQAANRVWAAQAVLSKMLGK